MPNQTTLIVFLMGALGAIGGGMWYGHTRYADGLTAGRSELKDYRIRVDEQRERDAAAAEQRYQGQVAERAAADQALSQINADLAAAHERLNRRITHAAQAPLSVPGQPAAGLLSVDGLQFYNDALGLSLRAGDASAAAGQPAAADAAAGAADSGVSREDLLTHIADYGAWCRTVAAQRDQLQEINK